MWGFFNLWKLTQVPIERTERVSEGRYSLDDILTIYFSQLESKEGLTDKEAVLFDTYHRKSIDDFDQTDDCMPIFFSGKPTPSRLDELESYALIGLDLKIEPEENVKVIEWNSYTSGMHGFKLLNLPYNWQESDPINEGLSDSFGLRSANEWSELNAELEFENSENQNRERLLNHLRYLYGIEQLTLQWSNRSVPFGLADFHHASKGRKKKKWAEQYREVFGQSYNIQQQFGDKHLFDRAFEDLRMYKPQTYLFTEEGFEAFQETYQDQDRVVLKPKTGSRGNGVLIEHIDMLRKRLKRRIFRNWKLEERIRFREDYVIEPFIESKDIYSQETGKAHDGVMRYIVLVEQKKHSGDMQIYHFSGYWRLCPEPKDGKTQQSYQANLGKNAIPQRATTDELSLVKAAIHDFLPKAYRKLSVASATP